MTELEYADGLLELENARGTGALIDRALRLVVARASARYGYIEAEAEPRNGSERRMCRAHDCTEPHIAVIQARISQTIILKTMQQGVTVLSPSAIDDPRFKAADSVRQYEIGAVLCVPFGRRLMGAIYLQSPTSGGSFSEDVRLAIERAARHLTALFEPQRFDVGPPLSAREQADLERRERVAQAFAKHGDNFSAIERETRISRKELRKMLRKTRRNRDDES